MTYHDEGHPYTARELEQLPTLATGQAEDLKVCDEPLPEEDAIRWWLSRCGPEDGETHRVHCERLVRGKWTVTGEFEPFYTADDVAGSEGEAMKDLGNGPGPW